MVHVLFVVEATILVVAILVKVEAIWVFEAAVTVNQEACFIVIFLLVFFP